MKKKLLSLIFLASTLLTFSQTPYKIHDPNDCLFMNNYLSGNGASLELSVDNPDLGDIATNPKVTKLTASASSGVDNLPSIIN